MENTLKIIKYFIDLLIFLGLKCKRLVDFLYRKSDVWAYLLSPAICFYLFKMVEKYSIILSRLIVVVYFLLMLYYSFLLFKAIFILIKGVKYLEYFKPHKPMEDCKKRAEIISKALGILYTYVIIWDLFISKNNSQVGNFELSTTILVFVLFGTLYILLKFANIVTTTIIIYASSLFGLVSLLYVMIFLININSSIKILSSSNIKNWTTVVLLIPRDYRTIITFLAISLIIQLMIVFFYPVYLMPISRLSFKIISAIFGLATVGLLLFSTEIKNILLDIIYSNRFEMDVSELSIAIGKIPDVINEGYVQSIINVVFLPYTIGSLICSFFIDLREESAKKKAKKYFYKALNYSQNKYNRETNLAIKKCIYFGGDDYELNVYNTLEFRDYLIKLGYQSHINNIIKKSVN